MMKRPKRIITAFVVAACAVGCGPKPRAPIPAEPPIQEQPGISQKERLTLASSYMDQGRNGEAAEYYREVLQEDPQNFEASLNLGIALMTMEDAKPESERDYTHAKHLFSVARDAKANDPRPHLFLGNLYFREKDYESAISALSVAVDLDPDSESAHETLGLALLEVGRPKEAKDELLRALSINPANEAANLELGRIYEGEGRTQSAMKHLEMALEANPNLDRATYTLERVYYNQALYQKAEAACRHFLKFYPEDVQSLEILGNIYRLQGHVDDMLEVYGRLTQIDPENTAYWGPIIQHYTDINAYEQARNVLEESLEHNPYYAYGNIHYGKVLMHYGDESLKDGNRQEALRLYSQARDHLRRAKIDDRYVVPATKLIDQVEKRIKNASGR